MKQQGRDFQEGDKRTIKNMDLNKKIVAVVEPNAAMSTALQRFLQTHGYASEVYASAELFLQRRGGISVDCLILNLDLGVISGMDFHKRLVERKAAPPVIFVTGDPAMSVDTAKLADGWVACLRMPTELRGLRHALAAALGTDLETVAAQPAAVPASATPTASTATPASPQAQASLSYAARWRASGVYVDNLGLRRRQR